MTKWKGNNKTTTLHREELLTVVETFYTELFRSQQNVDEPQTENLDKSGKRTVNQWSGEMPDITIDEKRNALRKQIKVRVKMI